MSRVRRLLVIALAVAIGSTGLVIATSPVQAQNPPGQGGNQGKNAGARKKPARRKARRSSPAGAIAPYPFPPALIIRQTPDTHDEIRAFLNMLRYQ